MALPTVLLKAKNVVSKGVNAARTASAVKSATSDSTESKSLFSGMKIIILAIVGLVLSFIIIPLIFILIAGSTIFAFPAILFADNYGVSSGGNGGVSGGTIGSGVAASVVECARQQIGKPYIWAAEGPNAFDCSGLVTYCYREALGVEVPHYTKDLATSNKFVTVSSVDELSAGDIILDGGSNIHHVGIYTGAGTVVHAPVAGMNVEEVSLASYQSWVGGYETYRHFIG